MNNQFENGRRPSADVLTRVSMRLSQVPDLKEFTYDAKEHMAFWHTLKVLFVPLGPKHMLGNARLPVESAAAKSLDHLQQEWGSGKDSFPALLALPKGTKNFKLEWAMVRPEDFEKMPEELLKSIETEINDEPETHYSPMETPNIQWGAHAVRSLSFVYAAKTGEWPAGSDMPAPFKELPAGSLF